MKKPFLKSNWLLTLIVITFLTNTVLPQNTTCGGFINPNLSQNKIQSSCGNLPSKYYQQWFYMPTATDPVITLNITIHVFCKSDGVSGRWVDDPLPPSAPLWNGRSVLTGPSYLGAITEGT